MKACFSSVIWVWARKGSFLSCLLLATIFLKGQLPQLALPGEPIPYLVDDMDWHFYRSQVAFQNLDFEESARQLRAGGAPLGLLVGGLDVPLEEKLESLRKELGFLAWEIEAGKENRPAHLSRLFARVHAFLAHYHFIQAETAYGAKTLKPAGVALEAAVQHLAHGLRYVEGQVSWELAPDMTAFEVAPDTYQGVVKTAHAMSKGVAFQARDVEKSLAYVRAKLRALEAVLAPVQER